MCHTRRQQPDGFGTTILGSPWCLSLLWMPQRKSLPHVNGRTRGLGFGRSCSVTHPTPLPGGEGLRCLHCGVCSLCSQLLQKHPDRCQHCLTDTRPVASRRNVLRRTSTALLSLPAVFCISNAAPFNSPFPLTKFGAVPRPRLLAQLHPRPH